MLELALKGRDIPAQGNALGQGSHHRQSPVRARHNPWPKKISKMRKSFKVRNLCIGFLKIFHKKQEVE
jgi:hypothetical protein